MSQTAPRQQPASRRFMTWLLRFFRSLGRTFGGIHLDKDSQPTQPDKFSQVAQNRVMNELTHLTEQ